MQSPTDLAHLLALLDSAVAINGTLTLMPDQCQVLANALRRQHQKAAIIVAATAFATQYRNTLDLDPVTHSQQQRLDAAWEGLQAALKAADAAPDEPGSLDDLREVVARLHRTLADAEQDIGTWHAVVVDLIKQIAAFA